MSSRSTRSFFRYYADKREVLFVGEDELPGVVARMFDGVDPELTPWEVLRQGFHTVVVPRLETFRDELATRRTIVASDEGLRERELRKLAILHDAATTAFRRHGLGTLDAEVAGRLAVSVYDAALDIWLAGPPGGSLPRVIDDVMSSVTRFTGTAGITRPRGLI